MTITKVEDEKAYNGDNFVCNIQSSEIENATFLFYGFNVNGVDTVADIQTWNSDLNKLKAAGYMFSRSNLKTFTGDLTSLTRGYQMFNGSKLISFSEQMPKLVNAYMMFSTPTFENFNVATLPKLSNAEKMFYNTKMTSFTTDVPHLSNANAMFMASNISNFNADISNLKTGYNMFSSSEGSSTGCPLSESSFTNIADKIKDISGLNKDDDSQWKYDTTKTDGTVNLNAGTISYDYRGVIHLHCDSSLQTNYNIVAAMDKLITKGWTPYLNGTLYEGEIQHPHLHMI